MTFRAVLCMVATVVLWSAPALAQTIYSVTNIADSGPGSLPQAVTDVNASGAAGTIRFDAGSSGDIALTTGLALTQQASLLNESGDDVTVAVSGAGNVTALQTTSLGQVGGSSDLVIEAVATGDNARGIYSTSFLTIGTLSETATVSAITAGQFAYGLAAEATVAITTLDGFVSASAEDWAVGISGADIAIAGIGETGMVRGQSATGNAFGLLASGAVTIGNMDGCILAQTDGSESYGIVSTGGSVTIGSIAESGLVVAMAGTDNASGISAQGAVTIENSLSGWVAGSTDGANATGIVSTGSSVTIGSIAETGIVWAIAGGDNASGISAQGAVTIENSLSGAVIAWTGGSNAYGIRSTGAWISIGSIAESGSIITLAAGNAAYGLYANSNVTITGHMDGDIAAQADTWAVGVRSANGNISIGYMTGSITATATGNLATGLWGENGVTIGFVSEDAAITAIAEGNAYGIHSNWTGGITISNNMGGTITATATGGNNAYGMLASNGSVSIASLSGAVIATAAGNSAFGIVTTGDLTMVGLLGGTITATAGGHTAMGLLVEGAIHGGDAATALPISGTISAQANGLAVAVGANGAMNLYVTGTLSGVDTSGGGDGYAIRAGTPDGIGGWTTGNANNTVVLGTGANLVGRVDLGDGTNTLGLLGTGTASNPFAGVTHLVAGDGLQATYWTLSPTAADAYTVDDATIHAGATLDVNENVTITGETVNDGTLVFDIGTGAIKDGAISGPGGVTKTGEGALILSGATTYTGTTLVAEGQLRLYQTLNSRSVGILSEGTLELDQNYTVQDTALVNGSLITPQLTVAQEATLSGTGVIHGNVIGNGVISPGNSPGDLTVVGDLTLNAGSLLAMEITTFDNDTLLVTGATAIHGGTLRLSVASGIYRAGDSFTLVSSEQGITGDFDAVSVGSASPFLLFDVETGDDAVEATVLRLPYTVAATTRNAQGAAAGLFGATYAATTSMQILLGTIDFTSASEVSRGLRQMSPEPYSALNETAFSSMRLFSDTIRDRAYARRSGGETLLTAVSAGNIGRLTQLASAAGVSDAGGGLDIKGTGTGMALFVKPVGQYQSFDNGHNRTGFQSWQYGVMAGGDAQVTDNFLAGFQVGYVHSDLRFKDDATSTGYADAFLGGVYASATAGGFYADGLVQAGAAVNHLDRRIEFGSISRQPTGKYTSFLFGASLSTGYEWTFGNFQAGPVGTLDYGYVSNPGFAESDPDLGLTVQGFTGNSLKTGLGAKISGTFTAGETTTISPDVALRWGHEFLNASRSIEARYNGSPTSGFLSRTGDPARDTLLVDAGVSFGMSESTKLYVRYSGEFLAQGSRTQAGAVGVRYEF
ncbi:autotransporter outer membrane beta-barrel domain-containing protein [Desulfolutivibrio sulfoxidireducens]|uniref:autotransporter outer membrane beta-barrel domain-containing protein n=1 Tax=Desulfolutivibrio sulfoxidireducens TaxID=2773299 RepID=UPI00159E4DAB|nr:autotransporter outer membrane beta-barrel domain-containing protein [Desulfolutivibrio sulfoxidireducens]